MANDCLNIGIIGAGKISELHAYGYLQHPKARIVAVADNRAGIAESRASEWGAENYFTDFRAQTRGNRCCRYHHSAQSSSADDR